MHRTLRLVRQFARTHIINPTRDYHHKKVVMASAASVAVYSAVLAATSSPPKNPTDVAQLKHHVNGGNSFTNPWPSFVDADAFKVGKAMLT
jgi:hypothetical protein